jgi:hypothetical protein
MFQEGEIIVCIDSKKALRNTIGLTLNKGYEVISYKGKPFDPLEMVHIINDRGESQNYHVYRFVSLTELRKRKINKICAK